MDFNFLLGEDYEIIDDDRLYVINGGSCTSGGAGSAAPSGGGGSGSTSTPSGGSSVRTSATETTTSKDTSGNNINKGTPQNVTGKPQNNGENKEQQEESLNGKYNRDTIIELYKEKNQFRKVFSSKSLVYNFESALLYLKEVGAFCKKPFQKAYKNITKFHFEDRDKLNVITESFEEISKSAENKDGSWILLSEGMSILHQNNIGDPELKFICKDGREAVFTKDFSKDKKYELYTDPRYKGTYNYCNPAQAPESVKDFFPYLGSNIKHGIYDVIPYYLTGKKNERDQ